jgi:hypothetical protein
LQAVALFLCNTFSSSKGSEWLMYSSTWKIDEVKKINKDLCKMIMFDRLFFSALRNIPPDPTRIKNSWSNRFWIYNTGIGYNG